MHNLREFERVPALMTGNWLSQIHDHTEITHAPLVGFT